MKNSEITNKTIEKKLLKELCTTDYTLENFSKIENKHPFRTQKGLIYKITNLINNKIYIGQTSLTFYRRYRDGFSRCNNPYLNRSLEKYGINNFTVEILEHSKDIDELNELEVYYINKFNTTNIRYGYNLRTGGENSKHTPLSLKRISLATKGKNKGKDNKNSKKTILEYKGETIIRDCRADIINYIKEKYNISITHWFDGSIPYEHQNDVGKCGYILEDGTIEECKRSMSREEYTKLSTEVCSKPTQIIYKGGIYKFNSKVELTDFMKSEFNLNINNWWGESGYIPNYILNDVTSCGYILEDGTIEECKRNSKYRGKSQSKPIQVIYNGEIIRKNSFNEMSKYLKETYGIGGVKDWKSYGIPKKYNGVITSCGFINDDGTICEFISSKECYIKYRKQK